MTETQEVPIWAQVVAGVTVCSIVLLIALTAMGGWQWTLRFLESAAPAWIQAIGSLAAIGAVFLLAQRESRSRSASERAIARMTVLRMAPTFVDLHGLCNGWLAAFKVGQRKPMSDDEFSTMRNLVAGLKTPTEEQLVRLTVLPGGFARKLANALNLMESVIQLLDMQNDKYGKRAPIERVESARLLFSVSKRMLDELDAVQTQVVQIAHLYRHDPD